MAQGNEKKQLLSNFFSLSILQVANYILPLLTFPYLVRVLGVEYFGLLSFATAVIAYFNIITDYGFNLTATREIAVHRENHTKVVEIFSAVMSIQAALMVLSFLLLILLVFSFEKFAKDWEIYLLTFGAVMGQVLFPVWFFQGMERMKYIAYLNIAAKSIFTVAIFVFVHEQKDFYLVPFFTSMGFLVVGIWSLWIIYKEFGIRFKIQSVETLKYYLLDGWYLFKTRVFVSLYTVTNTFMLGLLTNNITVGYYSIAERIINAISGLFSPANQALYPYLANIYNENIAYFKQVLKKISLLYLIVSFLLFSIAYLFSTDIIEIVNGSFDENIYAIYFILSFLIFTAPFGSLFSQVMVISGLNKKLSRVVSSIALLNIIFVPAAIYLGNYLGMALVVVCLQYILIAWCYIEININYEGKK